MKQVEEWLLPVSTEVGGDEAEAPLQVGRKVLAFTQQKQEQIQWCWAAITSSIALYYNAQSPWTQCELASVLLGGECCARPYSPACNRPCDLTVAMQRAQVWVDSTRGKPPFVMPMGELNDERPLAIVIQWRTGFSHAVTIVGYTYDTENQIYLLLIADPTAGVSWVDYNHFPDWYSGGGAWRETNTS